MDEPLSNLDAKLRVEMRGEIIRVQRRIAAPTLYVTHDQTEAMTMGDRVAILRDGLLQQLGTPDEVYDRPVNAFVAGFIGSPSMNLLPAGLDGRRRRLRRSASAARGWRPEAAGAAAGAARLPGEAGHAGHPARGLRHRRRGRRDRRDGGRGWSRWARSWSPTSPVRDAADTLLTARLERRASLDEGERGAGDASTLDRLYFFDPEQRRPPVSLAPAAADDLVGPVAELDHAAVHGKRLARVLEQVARHRLGDRPAHAHACPAARAVGLVQPQHQRVGVLGPLDRVEHQVGVVHRQP